MKSSLIATGLLAVLARGQQPQYPPAFPLQPSLAPSYNNAPSVLPNILDTSAPNAQNVCPGYKASNVQQSSSGLQADLILAGTPCNVYGNDIQSLVLSVQYQSKSRLAVSIVPKYLAPHNESLYLLSEQFTPRPGAEDGSSNTTSDLTFSWSNDPSFQFEVSRVSSGETIFSTYGKKIVFEDQFLELVTSMVPDYNVYGLAESFHSFRLGNNYTQTFWNAYNLDNDQLPDVNGHSTHPMYLETRYGNGSSTSHGVYARNAHGQEWLLREDAVTYRTIGGSFDLYFLSGPDPKDVISQYQVGIINTPVMQSYWSLGFHQCRWGYLNWTNLRDVVELYAEQGIQLEGIMNDLDYLNLNRIFTNNANYPVDEGKEFLDWLHSRGQYYLPILDPNVYAPDPANASDAYAPYDRGVELDVFIRNGNDSLYYGAEWNGFSVWPDFTVPQTQQFWTEQMAEYRKKLAFDGFWLDVSDPTSWCTGSCGQYQRSLNPVHVPFALPGDPNTSIAVDFRYPEMFNVTNATEAASAMAARASQMSAYPSMTLAPSPVLGRTLATPGVRNVNFPPYAINNFLSGHSLLKQVIAPNATHLDGPYNSTEYELHNLYGHLSGNATYNALVEVYDGKRPWFISRSTFAGSGSFAGHWGGDTNSNWGDMYFGISQALQMSIAGIPYFGVETCGFNGNADMELCTRWMQLSAWFPMYRNHNNRNTIAQEAYRWSTTAESTRRIMNIRYSLLPYTYTLFHKANKAGETVLRALAWEFPEDASLRAIDNQFMSGPALLVTPVLAPLATSVQGVFPGIASGTIWYDWYTLQKVDVAAGENKTLSAPIEHQPISVRGGYIIPIQKAGNTTATSRKSPWSLLIALDKDGKASGELYLDDGINIIQNATKNVEIDFANGMLSTKVTGAFQDGIALANITIAGASALPKDINLHIDGAACETSIIEVKAGGNVTYITGLEGVTTAGAWQSDMTLKLVY
ncbi:putative alpha-glucosidase AgdA [Aureobasidium pullulans]|uniref:alpha-glucosidase n=1 Tax=Aureobasidium pullulans TaxID=5580 RepID=A0A4S8T0R9_AURPU|nr:putative alpha-glucosidase AgdA [Aureobasidium pullulans]THZ78389.1 putative alpha-glucosidase AgdA [Aureobasidium pullulans]